MASTTVKIALGTVFLLGSTAAMAAQLQVEVTDIASAEGTICLALYDDPKTFRKEGKSLQRLTLPAEADEVRFTIENLPPGRYALIVYHDADSNGKMNRFLGMIPTEGYGLSTNPEVSGPPAFKDAEFALSKEGESIRISLNY
jgi:uncharacterized protein (DUF2141 family)